MRARHWITLSLRLVGLASVLWGVYNVISIVQAKDSMASLQATMQQFAKDTPVAGMFNADSFRPSYVGPALWIGVGLALMLISGPLTRLLFSGMPSGQPTTASDPRAS
jgi:hypothetical protein